MAEEPLNPSTLPDESALECALTTEDARLLVHELRAPMTAIVGYAGMLRHTDSDEDRGQIIDGLERAVTRMDAMLGEAARGVFKRGSRVTPGVRIDLAVLAREAAADQLASSATEVEVAIRDEAAVSGDALLLRRAIDNLLTNALLYGGDATVEIAVMVQGETAIIEVLDRGPGIPEVDRDRIWLPLERLQRDTDTPGTGLGLSVVASVAEAHGGRARILAREGGGTVVRLELPLVP